MNRTETHGRRWMTPDADAARVGDLAGALALPAPIVRALLHRGLGDAAAIDRYLRPRLSDLGDPFALPDMAPAVDRVWRAIDAGERIVVHGDYDVDGVAATALLTRALRGLGADAQSFLPRRMDDGYGLQEDTVDRCVTELGARLLVTVDSGTNADAAVRRAAAQGVDAVVTDHHEPHGALAPAVAVVNPRRAPDAPWSDLAGVSVAFKLAHALVKRGRDAGRPAAAALDLRGDLPLVALGTIADIVPLRRENRILARFGLDEMTRAPSAGLSALIAKAGVRPPIDGEHVGYYLGPRLNAAGRLGTAEASLELLLTEDPARARALAEELDRANRERQDVENGILAEAVAQVEAAFRPERDYAIVAAARGWHPGVIGIVASRLVSRFRRPAVVIALDGAGGGRGSCRSVPDLNLVESLAECEAHLRRFGGHAMAAGLEIEEADVGAFREALNAVAARRLAGIDLRPVETIDAWISLNEADESLLGHIDAMRPFGCGNPAPVWATSGARLLRPPRVVGTRHLKLCVATAGSPIEAIAFGMAGRAIPEGPIDIAFRLQRNTFNGATRLQLNVRDLRASAG